MILRLALSLLVVLAGVRLAVAQEPRSDLVIRHARIADGLGGPLFEGDLAVRGGRIIAVGTVAARGLTEFDAQGLVVAPGFIDVHTHSENIDDLPQAENFLRMGVTTIVTGNCGGSKTRVGEFFRQLESSNVAVNVATLIGHNTVRNQVMGGSFLRPPTDDELRQMRALVDQAMRDGAVGLSTGLIYLPGTFATTDEIVALAKVAAQHGGIYVSHMRYETTRIFEALQELFTIAREADIPAEVSHLKLSGPNAWGMADRVLSELDFARKRGLRVTHDQYAYTASSTGLSQLIPSEAREGGNQRFLERLNNPAQKAEIVAEMKRTLKNGQRTNYAYAVIASYAKDKSLNGKSIPEAAKLKRGSDSLDDQIELLFELQREGGAAGVFHNMDEPDLQRFLQHPLTMVASDSGPRSFGEGVPHPRGYGNNARVLGRYVRELKLLTLEEAVRKMTSLPARTHRLGQRGQIKPGFTADLVVFDPAKVNDPATFDSPHHYAEGFSHVFVNGVAVISDGKLTGKLPGLPVRREVAPAAN
jgi:N-acyl-D-amino-acid deacylase